MIRVVFLGTPQFAVPALQALVDQADIEIPLVVTQPDRRAGRGRGVRPPAVKETAEARSIPVSQPETTRDQSVLDQLDEARPDVIVVVSYGEILRRSVLELPPHGCLNVHPSLLPAYRGASPIPAAILNGDPEIGVSFMRLVRKMDAGPVIHQERVPLDGSENTGSLTELLARRAGEQLPGVVRDWVHGRLQEHPQDEQRATYTRELRKSDAQVDWSRDAGYIERFVRAMDPWPRAWSVINGARLAIHELRGPLSASEGTAPGTLLPRDDSVQVATGQGLVELVTVQPAGKKPIAAAEWLRGARIEAGAVFESPGEPSPPIIYAR